jgi:hypothetical protein
MRGGRASVRATPADVWKLFREFEAMSDEAKDRHANGDNPSIEQ